MKLDIYQYGSALQFFTDSYKALKLNSETSLREWTADMGLNSPVLILDILKKKRPLKLKYAEFIAKGFHLNSQEKTYFKTLIQLEKASDEEKIYLGEVLSSLRPKDINVTQEGGIFSHWLNVIIHLMGKMKKAPLSLQEIKTAVKQDVSMKTIEESLNVLIASKLIEKTNDGMFVSIMDQHISTPNDVPQAAIHNYYSQVIAKAEAAIKMDIHDREFQCFAIGMKKENLGKVKDVMRKARLEIASFSDDSGDHIYQFNLNGFPMAEITQ